MLDMDNTAGMGIPHIAEEMDDSLGYSDLFEQVWQEEELIFTIPEEDHERFKAGMAVAKSRFNSKMEKEGMPPDKRSLSFAVVPCSTEGCISLHVKLVAKGRVRVLNIEKPDNTL